MTSGEIARWGLPGKGRWITTMRTHRELLAGHKDVRGERLDHYIKTLRFLSDGRPDLPFLSELSEELMKLVDREPA